MHSPPSSEDILLCAFDFPKLYHRIHAWWGENIRTPCGKLIRRYKEQCMEEGREPNRNNAGRQTVRKIGSFNNVPEIFRILDEELRSMELAKRPSSLLQPKPLTTQAAVKLFKNYYILLKDLNQTKKQNLEYRACLEDLLDVEEYRDTILKSRTVSEKEKVNLLAGASKDLESNKVWMELVRAKTERENFRKHEIEERNQRKRRLGQIEPIDMSTNKKPRQGK